MGKSVANPRRHIVSVRLSDQELAVFDTIQRRTGADRSQLLRMAVDEFVQAARELGGEGMTRKDANLMEREGLSISFPVNPDGTCPVASEGLEALPSGETDKKGRQ